ncbi:MAG: hypothetical protein ABDH21_05350 [bacterium]
MNTLSVKDKIWIVFDTSTSHSTKCNCKNCRTKKEPPKIKLLIPAKIKNYFPVLVINPFISYAFVSKFFELVNSNYLDISFDATKISIIPEIKNLIQTYYSEYFYNCLNFIFNRDIFNAVGYFEDNITNFNEFETLYLGGLINFYLQNVEKAYESFSKAFELLYNRPITSPLDNLETDYINLFFLFDFMIVSLNSREYQTFSNIFNYLLEVGNDFTIYALMLYIFSFFYFGDMYILIESTRMVREKINQIVQALEDLDSPKLKAYILYLFLCISIYREESYNILQSEIQEIINHLDNSVNLQNVETVINKCQELDKDNVLYKLTKASIDLDVNREIIAGIEFLPINKVLHNFAQYSMYLNNILKEMKGSSNTEAKRVDFKKVRDLVEQEPNNPFFWFLNGLYSFAVRDFDVATNYFRGAVATDKNFTEARIMFGICLFITGDIERSIKILENSLNNYTPYIHDTVLINLASINKYLNNHIIVENIFQELSDPDNGEIFKRVIQ